MRLRCREAIFIAAVKFGAQGIVSAAKVTVFNNSRISPVVRKFLVCLMRRRLCNSKKIKARTRIYLPLTYLSSIV